MILAKEIGVADISSIDGCTMTINNIMWRRKLSIYSLFLHLFHDLDYELGSKLMLKVQ